VQLYRAVGADVHELLLSGRAMRVHPQTCPVLADLLRGHMSTGIEHMRRHRTAQRGLERECQRHKGSLLATQGTRTVLDGLVIGKNVPTRGKYVRSVLFTEMRVVSDRDVDAARVCRERAGFVGLEACLQNAFLGVLVGERDAVKEYGTVGLERVEMLHHTVRIHLSSKHTVFDR